MGAAGPKFIIDQRLLRNIFLLFVAFCSFLVFLAWRNFSVKNYYCFRDSALGQNLVVGFDGTELDERIKTDLGIIKPAGIVFYSRNYRSDSQFKKLVSDLQVLARQTTGCPYFTMIDEEPGGATRLRLFQNFIPVGTVDWVFIKRDIAFIKDLGINVVLAPVADFVTSNSGFMRSRTLFQDAVSVKNFNKNFIDVLENGGVSATLKHFPGLGLLVADPHKKLSVLMIGDNDLQKSLEIFQNGVQAGADFVMTTHTVFENIDPGTPAVFSKIIVEDLLRNYVGFKGIVLTDDISGMPVFLDGRDGELDEAAAGALEVGHNLVMLSHNLEKTKMIVEKLTEKVHSDPDFRDVVMKNYLKISDFKDDKFGTRKKCFWKYYCFSIKSEAFR